MLEDHYDIEEYVNGLDAVQGISSAPPDLVLLDISLPGQDGIEVLDVLRSEHGLDRLPIIALTAHAMAGDRERYLAAGFDGYISKPIVDDEVLLETIEGLLIAA